MSTLNSMQQKLKPLGLYNLNSNSLINAELSAYAAALDIIESLLAEVERECFISTAQSFGLSLRERMLGSVKNNKSIVERRNSLLYRNSITSNSFNKSDIEKVLSVAGVNGYIIEMPSESTIYINCLNLTQENLNRDSIKNSIQEFLPAHLNVVFDFSSLQWDILDFNDRTFDQWDSDDLTWNDFDNFDEII